MLINLLKIFFRLLSGNRVFSFINLLGLTTGIVCFVLIRLYVKNEYSYDRHIPLADRTYRLALKGEMSGFSFESAVMGGPFGRVIREEVPGVISSTTFYKLPGPVLLNRGEHRFYEDRIIYADTLFAGFFGYKVTQGNPRTMLEAPWSMVLTRSGARKYFGQEDPLGKVITWNNRQDYTVTGIIEDPSENSHLHFDILASYSSLIEQATYRNLLTSFYAFVTYNYIKLVESADPARVKDDIAGVLEKYMGEGMHESSSHFELYLQPVTGIHLHSNLVHELEPNGSHSSVLIFSVISMLILLIACVNFINLTTARSADRIVETGIRHAYGAGRDILILQFLLESICFALCGVLIAGILVELLITPFCNFSGINPHVPGFTSIGRWIRLLPIAIVVGMVSGFYPALQLSRSKPVWLLGGSIRTKPLAGILRNSLVVIQLAITIFLVSNTLLIYKQLRLVNRTDPGIAMKNLLIIPMRSQDMVNQYVFLKNELMSVPGVRQVTASSSFLGNFQQRRGFLLEGFERNDVWMLHHISVDPNYLEVMGTRFVMGRNFRTGSKADSNAVIINLAMMTQTGWDKPIGKKIIMQSGGRELEYFVIGLVNNFNFASIHDRVESLLIFDNVGTVRYLGVRINDASALAGIKEKWDSLYPDYPFDFFYQKEYYQNLYRADRRMGSLFIYFTALAILISVLGLFGLVQFTSSRRAREIGIRKVLGGDYLRIVRMLLRKYPIMIGIATLFALPTSWYYSRHWLENFAVKTPINSWIYIISVILVLVICLSTVLLQTLKTAGTNPADVLRHE